MSELLPCPFCAGAVAWCGEQDPTDIHECHQITCPNCGQFDLRFNPEREEMADMRSDVIALWNTRATQPDNVLVPRDAIQRIADRFDDAEHQGSKEWATHVEASAMLAADK